MRALSRPREPAILTEKKARWSDALAKRHAKDPGARPPTAQYGHEQIVAALAAMSHHKCFYCEQSVKDRFEVDHRVELRERVDLAFEWSNLDLTCFECNRKKRPNLERPVAACLDPCDASQDPREALTFDREFIRPRSPRGAATIQKYLLSRPDLDHKRVTQLQRFTEVVLEIERRKGREARAMSEGERELLRSFAAPDHPFSRMFEVCLEKWGLIAAPANEPG